ncbi:MAG TPA: DUF3566 domain-containing protein [Ilumatobacteraceae bacterium]|nr:DUF3566 domain-containing protein [Ilumatobacteraceae bacterium]
MSPSERRAAEVGDVDDASSPPENASAPESALDSTLDRKIRARTRSTANTTTVTGADPVRPVEIPDIIPATIDVPAQPEPRRPRDVAQPVVEQDRPIRQIVTTPRREAIDAWQQVPDNPVVVPVAVTAGGRAGVFRSPGRRPRVRKVTRVVRHIDPWSTFKVALLFSIVLYGVLLTAGVLLWNVASNTGTVDNIERWFTQFGWESYELKGGEIFHNAWIAGLFGVVGLTGLAVLSATLFNLISDMVGGVRVTVLEEEVVERTTSQSDRFVIRRPTDGATPVAEFDLEGDLDVPANGTGPAAARAQATPKSG